MVKIIIGKKDCTQCQKLKDSLDSNGEEYLYYQYEDLTKEEKKKIYEIRKFKGVEISFPLVFITKLYTGYPPIEL